MHQAELVLQVSSTFLGVTAVLPAYGALRVLQTHAMVSTPNMEPGRALEAAGSYCIAHVVQDRCRHCACCLGDCYTGQPSILGCAGGVVLWFPH